MFTKHEHNAVAKIIRENFPVDTYNYSNRHEAGTIRAVLADLALEFAKYFVKDNPKFDPYEWLDRCSADAEMYPLSELYEDYIARQ